MRNLVPHGLSKRHCVCLALALAFMASCALAQAQPQPPAAPETTLSNMLTALQNRSLADFVADGDAAFKSGMTGQMFAGVSGQFGPGLARGYTTTFLGKLNQHGYTVYLWKLVFKDGQDDRLVEIAVKDGKVGGFVLN